MSDELHCPNCPKGKLYPFRRVTAAEEKHIASVYKKKGAHGFWRCQGKTARGQCLWVQPYFNQADGFSLPESFS